MADVLANVLGIAGGLFLLAVLIWVTVMGIVFLIYLIKVLLGIRK